MFFINAFINTLTNAFINALTNAFIKCSYQFLENNRHLKIKKYVNFYIK